MKKYIFSLYFVIFQSEVMLSIYDINQAVNKVTTTFSYYLLNSNSPGNPLIGVFSYEEKDSYDRSIR